MIDIHLIPILKDNYAYLLQSPCGKTAIIDPGEADPIIKILDEKNLVLDYILITHHHWDHVSGIVKLKRKYNCSVISPEKEFGKIKGSDIKVSDKDIFELGSEKAQVILTPGHTVGAICYYFKNSKALFTGDTLFSLGCGRLFEGSARDMFESLEKLKYLPDDTLIYCGHEYTRENAKFCLIMEPDNDKLKKRIEEVENLRSLGKATIPSTIKIEKETNIFLRVKDPDEFKIIRQKKDSF